MTDEQPNSHADERLAEAETIRDEPIPSHILSKPARVKPCVLIRGLRSPYLCADHLEIQQGALAMILALAFIAFSFMHL